MNLPLVSVVICTRNRIEYLKKCLVSIIRQSFKPLEIILIDDASDRRINIFSIICDIFRKTINVFYTGRINIIKVRNKQRLGMVKSRNIGLSIAKGDIVTFLDDDSRAHKHWLRNLVKNYRKNIVGVGGTIVELGRKIVVPKSKVKKICYRTPSGEIKLNSKVSNIKEIKFLKKGKTKLLQGSNMSFRRDALLKVNGFNPVYRGNALFEERDVSLRISKIGNLIFEPNAIVYHYSARHGGARDIKFLSDFFYWHFRNITIFSLTHSNLWKGFRFVLSHVTKYIKRLLRGEVKFFRDYLIFDSILKVIFAIFSGVSLGILFGLLAEIFLKKLSYESYGYATLITITTLGGTYKIITKKVAMNSLIKRIF